MLALGFVTDLEEIKRMIAEVKARTDKPFGANLMIAMNPKNDAILELLAEEGITTVTTSAGAPKKIYPKIKELGMKVLHVALAAPLAVKAAEGWGGRCGGFRDRVRRASHHRSGIHKFHSDSTCLRHGPCAGGRGRRDR